MKHVKKFNENFENIADPSHGLNMSEPNEKEVSKFDQPYVKEGVLVDLSQEKVTMKCDDGELSLSVFYDEQGDPSSSSIAIESDCQNPGGFLELKTEDVKKLFMIAQSELDNFPKIF